MKIIEFPEYVREEGQPSPTLKMSIDFVPKEFEGRWLNVIRKLCVGLGKSPALRWPSNPMDVWGGSRKQLRWPMPVNPQYEMAFRRDLDRAGMSAVCNSIITRS